MHLPFLLLITVPLLPPTTLQIEDSSGRSSQPSRKLYGISYSFGTGLRLHHYTSLAISLSCTMSTNCGLPVPSSQPQLINYNPSLRNCAVLYCTGLKEYAVVSHMLKEVVIGISLVLLRAGLSYGTDDFACAFVTECLMGIPLVLSNLSYFISSHLSKQSD